MHKGSLFYIHASICFCSSFFLNWSIIALQHCLSFCCVTVNQLYVYIHPPDCWPSLLHYTLSHPSRLLLSPEICVTLPFLSGCVHCRYELSQPGFPFGCRGPSPSFLTFRFPAFPEISMVWGQRRGSYKATHSDRVLVVSLVFIFTGGTRGSGDTSLHGAVLGWEQPLTCSYFSHIFHFHAVCLCLCGTRRCYNHLYLSGLSQLCLALE